MTLLQRLSAAFRPVEPAQGEPTPAPIARRSFDPIPDRAWNALPTAGRFEGSTVLNAFVMGRRARNAYAANPHARAAVDAWTVALVGTGARANPSHPDPETCALITAAVDTWNEVATLDGLADWGGAQAAAVRSMIVDGEALIQLIDTPDGLRLRQIPASMLDEASDGDLNNGGFTVGGIEHDAWGRRVAYHIRRRHNPANPWAPHGPAERIAACDIIHLFHQTAPDQVRGVSWLAPILGKLNDVDRLSESLLTGAAVAAAFAGFITDETGQPGTDDQAGGTLGRASLIDMEPGTIKELPAGKKVTFSAPQQAQQTDALMSSELRAVAVGMGVPAHLVSGDLTKANYSSLRADLVAFRQRVEAIQYGIVVPQLLKRVHERAVASLAMMGDLDAPDFFTDRRAWTAAEYLFPAMPWVDPAKDAAAYRELIESGLTSRRQVVAERGWSIEALDAEIAADRQREAALGLSFGKPVTVPQTEGQDDDD